MTEMTTPARRPLDLDHAPRADGHHDSDAAEALTPDCDPADPETAQAHATLT